MRAAVARRDRLSVEDVAEPVPLDGHLLVAPLATGICGSDLHALLHLDRFSELAASQGVDPPDPERGVIFGHELVAEILDYGPGAQRTLPVGQRVCSMPILLSPNGIEQLGYSPRYPGAMAERMVLQESFALPVPDSLATPIAALTEPLAVGEHAVGLADLRPGQPTLVLGCGPVGLAVIAALRARGHGPVVAADFSARRRALAEAFGADEVVDPAERSPHTSWAQLGVPATLMDRMIAQALGASPPTPVIFECVGVPGMLQSILADAPARSRVVVVGVCMEPDVIEPFVAIVKEVDLRFSFGYSGEEFAATLERLGRGVPGADQLVTSVVDLEGVAGAFASLATPGEQGKILVRPNGGR